jgi:undecaprenyl-diphosphatase
MIIEAIKAFFFGIVEGITEWLPISSTGHMMLFNQFVQLDVSPAFYDTFLVVVQLGAIMAVIILYFNKLNPFSFKKTPQERRNTWGIWARVVIGTIPAGIVGFLLDDWMEEHIMNSPSAYLVVSGTLIVYGIIFIVIERYNRKREANLQTQDKPRGKHARIPENAAGESIFQVNSFEEMSFGKAFLIGIFQSLAVIPGTSRSGAIIIGSMVAGTSRTIATEFAFFLAIPIMFGWSVVKLIKHGLAFSGAEWILLCIGTVVSFVVSIFAIRFLVGYVKKNDFTAFGWYRIILGVLVIGYFGSKALGLW